jgi:hypothetical protein
MSNNNSTLYISSLSFDEYVLIDCLKFEQKENTNYSHSDNLTFVALSKQGFLNIFNEIKKFKTDKYGNALELYNNKVIINIFQLVVTIKYALNEQHFKTLIDLPCLDFYKKTL